MPLPPEVGRRGKAGLLHNTIGLKLYTLVGAGWEGQVSPPIFQEEDGAQKQIGGGFTVGTLDVVFWMIMNVFH